MDWEGKSLRVGAMVIACAVVLRLLSSLPAGGLSFLTDQRTMSALLFLSTGRLVRPAQTVTENLNFIQTEPTSATEEAPTPAQLPVFAKEDVSLVEINSSCSYQPDVPALLTQPLSWDLTREAPTVLIVHTHGSESYQPTGEYKESAAYRTLDMGYNVVSVGDRLVQVLQAGGVGVVHDRTLHDSPSYSDAYVNARSSIEDYMEKYPSIQLVLDIHRDSVADGSGGQVAFAADVEGGTSARLMLVVGSDASGLNHPDWPENMSLAVKLHAQLEKNDPGICRPISFRSQRYNQDLSPGALIVEVGSAGNTRQEALLAAERLGAAILDLCRGTGEASN